MRGAGGALGRLPAHPWVSLGRVKPRLLTSDVVLVAVVGLGAEDSSEPFLKV